MIHSSPAVLLHFVTFVNPTHVVQMHFANLERTKEREKIDQCVFVMRDTEVSTWVYKEVLNFDFFVDSLTQFELQIMK